MKIVVCIKQVVDSDDIKWTKNNTLEREGVESVINPCDMLALETALKLKDKNDNVHITVLSMGPPQAVSALKTAIAMGCDEAFLVSDKKFSGADTVATSRTLSAAITHTCPDYDLIVCGQFASDGDTAQTGPSIAEKLDTEQVTYVHDVREIKFVSLAEQAEGFEPQPLKAEAITVARKSDEAVEVIECPLPAVICVCECDYEARRILINGYMRAQDYTVEAVNLETLGLSPDDVGIKGSPTYVSRAFRAISNRKNELLMPETTSEAVNALKEAFSTVNAEVE